MKTLREKDVARFWSKVDVRGPDDCWEWTASLRKGYGQFKVGGRVRKSIQAHRISAHLAGQKIEGLFVCHRCDNPPCCNPAHLFAGTVADNNRDMAAKGRSRGAPPGEKHGRAKLTKEQVLEIRELSKRGVPKTELARRFGIHDTTVGHIARRLSWKCLP